MISLFGKRALSIIGLDISTSSVKMVELAGNDLSKASLANYVIEPLPRDCVVDGNINNMDLVVETIKRARRKLKSRTKQCALSLPTGSVITKKMFVPGEYTDDEMELQIEADANQYIPFPLDEVNIDYQILGQRTAADQIETEVLLVAAKKDKIEDRVAAAESAGFTATVVDVDSYALQAMVDCLAEQLPGNGQNQNIAVFDIGAHATRLYVYRNGEVLFTRENTFGGNQLTQDIQRAFNMTSDEAEAAKVGGGLPPNYELDVLKPYVDTLAIELVRSIQFFFSSSTHTQIDHIFLGGGCARIQGLTDAVQRRTNVNTTQANPFLRMLAEGAGRNGTQDAPALLIASGLALRRFQGIKS